MTSKLQPNALVYGDNLLVLREYVADESVDLIYLDPPFNSARNYNVLFDAQDGSRSAAQIKAFKDTWRWDSAAGAAYHEIVERGGKVSEAMQAFRILVGDSDMLAYLAMMAPRLVELHRVLKPTGSLYLHCDPTASHYLKLLLDAVFGPRRFMNEITWKRTTAHSDPNRYGANTDTLLFYAKGDQWNWNQLYVPYDEAYKSRFRFKDPDGRVWMDDNLTAKGLAGGGYEYTYKGARSYWRCPPETMKRLDDEGRLHFTRTGGIRLKRYLGESKGYPIQALWDDIAPINSQAQERLGYPTQKPEALLDRIIEASSNEGDVVLDPFCGCGTTIASAQRLKRQWIGIDITSLAINLIKSRLDDAYGDRVRYSVIGEPVSVDEASQLASDDPWQFQLWALSLVHARTADEKKGADRGIDGRKYFHLGETDKKTYQVILSVKAGHVSVSHVRDLLGVLERESASIGVFISLQPPTKAMRKEAASAGFFETPWGRHPRLQLLTIEELLGGKRIDMPQTAGVNRTFRTAPRAKGSVKHPELFDGEQTEG